MKLFWILLLIFSHHSYSQIGLGALQVTTYKNETNNLNDNYSVDTTFVRIIKLQYSIDTNFTYVTGIRSRIALKPGKYKLVCSFNKDSEITIENVIISADKITFVELLIEPKIFLSKSQLRKRRKKNYANYIK